MSTFSMEYRVIGYSLAHAFSTNPKSGKKGYFVESSDIGTECIKPVFEAADSNENTPEGYKLFSVTNVDTGEVLLNK